MLHILLYPVFPKYQLLLIISVVLFLITYLKFYLQFTVLKRKGENNKLIQLKFYTTNSRVNQQKKRSLKPFQGVLGPDFSIPKCITREAIRRPSGTQDMLVKYEVYSSCLLPSVVLWLWQCFVYPCIAPRRRNSKGSQ